MAHYRKRSSVSWIVWTSAVALLAILMAWHFDWMPGRSHRNARKNQEVATEVEGEAQAATKKRAAPIDPIIFSAQTEPPVEEADAGDPGGGLSETNKARRPGQFLSHNQWKHSVTDVAPLRRPALTSSRPGEVTQASFETTPRNGDPSSEQEPGRSRAGGAAPAAGEPEPSSSRDSVSKTARKETAGESARPAATEISLETVDQWIAEGKIIAAHRELSRLYWARPSQRNLIQTRIETTARQIYFSPLPHFMEPHVVGPNESLGKLAAKYKVSWEFLGRLNRVDEKKVRAGQKLKIISGPFSAIVDLSRYELTIHGHGYYVKKYTIGIGKDGSTPVGKFVVKNKLVNPRYFGPDGVVIHPDDPLNPLGERWIDLGDSYGIHGTIEPKSIGKAESKGCVRMRNEDVEEVYDFLTIGSEVEIRR